MVGLGRREQMITLYCPVAGETPLTPWATADRAALERNRPLIEKEIGTRVSITAVPVEIRRFDDLNRLDIILLENETGKAITLYGKPSTPALRRQAMTRTVGSAGFQRRPGRRG